MAADRPESDTDDPGGGAGADALGPVHVLVDGTLHRLVLLSDAAWGALPPHRRPRHARRCEGLGWVAAVPAPERNN